MTLTTAEAAAHEGGEFVLIRGRSSFITWLYCAPAYVMHVEKRTAQSLMGMIVRPDGEALDFSGGYDGNPQYERRRGWEKGLRERLRAGRVDKLRELASFSDAQSAHAALDRAKAAWKAAETGAADEARRAFAAAKVAVEKERRHLEEEMDRRLADLRDAATAAGSYAAKVNLTMHESMSAAAMAAIGSVPAPLATGERG